MNTPKLAYLIPLLSVGLTAACASPCTDDGLGQKFCPGDTDGGSATDSATATDSASVTNSASDSASDSASATDTDPTAGSAGGTGMDCPLLDVNLDPQEVTAVLLVDQSASMTADFGGTPRWDAVRTTLFNPMDGVVTSLEAELRFGLSLYTSDNGFMGGTCPMLTESPPALNNAGAMQMVFDANMPEGDTPTGESIASVSMALQADPAPGRKLIVLATDGEPDTCDEPDPQNGQQDSVDAAAAAFASGVETAVISVGDQVSQGHLQDLANAGAGVMAGDPDAPFYQALDQPALIDAFNQVLAGNRSCSFTLDQALVPAEASTCVVTVNGTEIPLDDPNGWQLNGDAEVELVGGACDSIQEGVVTIDMSCDCDAIAG